LAAPRRAAWLDPFAALREQRATHLWMRDRESSRPVLTRVRRLSKTGAQTGQDVSLAGRWGFWFIGGLAVREVLSFRKRIQGAAVSAERTASA
jgi:hypothetical protein